jgi:hypothetical protein
VIGAGGKADAASSSKNKAQGRDRMLATRLEFLRHGSALLAAAALSRPARAVTGPNDKFDLLDNSPFAVR